MAGSVRGGYGFRSIADGSSRRLRRQGQCIQRIGCIESRRWPVPPFTSVASRSSVADELTHVVERLLRRPLPFGLVAWDGSRAGPDDAPTTIVVHGPRALQH